jgi:rod shape-determining protein MreC
MNKWSLIGLTITISLTYHFFGKPIQDGLRPLSMVASNSYLYITKQANLLYDDHIAMAETNKKLRAENIELTAQTIKYKEILKELSEDIKLVKFDPYDKNSSVAMGRAKVLGYSNLPNLSRLWLDFVPTDLKESATQKIYGLVYPLANKIDSVACGIAVESSKKRYEAMLNGDEKCAYAVFVGKNRAPGIVYGQNNAELVIKYIPTWLEIKQGDEVITSGLDNIFFEGVKVGKVKKVITDNTYNEALVEAYFNPMSPTSFYVIQKASR